MKLKLYAVIQKKSKILKMLIVEYYIEKYVYFIKI